ncbi:MAG: ABC transporter substrate-binding protein [Xanthobacteraceae bacterium]
MAVCALMLAMGGPAPAQTPIKFSLDGPFEGPVSFLLLAQDRGYFRGAGLDVTVDEVTTAIEPITRVASGKYELALADINTLITYRDRNPTAPVKAIFMLYNTPPYAIIARKSRGITEPRNLEGKKLGAPPAGSTVLHWPLFARLNGIDPTKVTLEKVSIPVRAPMLAAGQLDAALGAAFRVYIDLKDRGVQVNDIVLMRMANYGIKLYGSAVIVNTKFAAEKPEAVRGFVSAITRGLRDTVRHPSAGIESLLRRRELLKKDVELERLRMAIRDNIVTSEVRENGYGAVDVTRLQESIDQIALTYTFKAKPKPDDIFDASFLLPAAQRRVN